MEGNFTIYLMDMNPKLEMSKWVQDPEKFNTDKMLSRNIAISSCDDMIGTAFCGCMNCLSKELQGNPIAKVLFKALWKTLSDSYQANGKKLVIRPDNFLNVYL